MKKFNKLLSVALAFCMAATTLTACGKGAAPTPSGSGSTSSNTPASVPVGERPKITMFLGDSGIPAPSGVDVSDNKFIKIVEDLAGADLEITQPAYADFQQQFNLLMSSGKLPDIVHSYFVDDTIKYAEEGAFIDLRPYYDKSPIMQAVVSKEAMELTKSKASGKNFRIPQATIGLKYGYGNWIRLDLLKEYNGGEFPKDVPGYLDFLYWVKKTYPESIPLAARSSDTKLFLYGEMFFKWYGAMPQSYNVVDGKVVSTFTLPEYRAAVELYRKLYADGILDKEFATTDASVYGSKMSEDNVAMSTDLPLSLQTANANAATNKKSNMYVYTPELETYPSEVKDPIYTKAFRQPPAGIHGFYISSTCKNPDLAWKVLEAFASEQLREAVTWGEEGVEHTVVNGKKVANAEALALDTHRFGLHLMVIPGFGCLSESQDSIAEQKMGEENYKLTMESNARVAKETEERGFAMIDVFRYTGGLVPEPPMVKEKKAEFDKFTAEATANAVSGQISMAEFDKKVDEYKTRYAFVDEEWTKALNENKDFLLSVGCTEAGR
ncbi:MAG: extracellular solute-binding protein [Oscillospiraceae bacterium]